MFLCLTCNFWSKCDSRFKDILFLEAYTDKTYFSLLLKSKILTINLRQSQVIGHHAENKGINKGISNFTLSV